MSWRLRLYAERARLERLAAIAREEALRLAVRVGFGWALAAIIATLYLWACWHSAPAPVLIQP